jgi:hypothetical protein
VTDRRLVVCHFRLFLGGQAFSIDSLTLTASRATNTFNNDTLTVGSVSINNAFTGSASLSLPPRLRSRDPASLSRAAPLSSTPMLRHP